jgi:hypothetical protein
MLADARASASMSLFNSVVVVIGTICVMIVAGSA